MKRGGVLKGGVVGWVMKGWVMKGGGEVITQHMTLATPCVNIEPALHDVTMMLLDDADVMSGLI